MSQLMLFNTINGFQLLLIEKKTYTDSYDVCRAKREHVGYLFPSIYAATMWSNDLAPFIFDAILADENVTTGELALTLVICGRILCWQYLASEPNNSLGLYQILKQYIASMASLYAKGNSLQKEIDKILNIELRAERQL
jgi:hypothetical protein